MRKTFCLRMIAAFIVAVALVSFFVMTNGTSAKAEMLSEQAQNTNVEEDIVVVKNPKQKSTVVLDNDVVADYFKNYKPNYGLKYFGKGEQLLMKPVKIEWEAENAKYCELWIANNARFKNAEKYTVLGNSVELERLIPNETYYWKVKTTDQNGEQRFSKVYCFQTEGRIRTVAIDGVSNVRDLGGAVTKDGKTIRYGMLYRSANGDSITEKGMDTVKKLGIKTDLDLRGNVVETSPFGKDVEIVKISAAYYRGGDTGIDGSEKYKNAFRDELKVCADPDRYPMLFHCQIGRDRTGTLSFVLQALCGVEKESLIREYELSYLSVDGTADGNQTMVRFIEDLYQYINGFSGATFVEKTENLVKSLGVTDKEIASIRSILLG